MSNKQTLLEELSALYDELQAKLAKASFLGKSMADKFVPIEKVLVFVGKVVQKVEEQEAENIFLKEEVEKLNLELARQNTLLMHVDGMRDIMAKVDKSDERD